jgi:hypothetical protein
MNGGLSWIWSPVPASPCAMMTSRLRMPATTLRATPNEASRTLVAIGRQLDAVEQPAAAHLGDHWVPPGDLLKARLQIAADVGRAREKLLAPHDLIDLETKGS